MPKVTSKLQVTVPKAIADEYQIRPGDEILWVSGGDVIRVIPPGFEPQQASLEQRLALFDAATARQRRREKRQRSAGSKQRAETRDWTRDDLYEGRGRSR